MTSAVLRLDEIERIVREEAAAQGGYVHELLCDEGRLYARTVNTPIAEVAPNDAIQAGVAVRVNGADVWVRPYIFRQVCLNGAIVANTDEAEEFDLQVIGTTALQESHLREAITACGRVKVLTREALHFRSLRAHRIDRAMMMMAMIKTHHAGVTQTDLLDILAQFESEEQNLWGMMNAVTAVARETRDPNRKWLLEEIGAMIPAMLDDRVRRCLDGPDWSELDNMDDVRELVLA
jgi:hypothetical protein